MAARGVPAQMAEPAVVRAQPRVLNATVREPEGITRRVMLNLLEAFFRRPWLYLLPIVLLFGFGVASAFSSPKEYRSVGTLSATTDQALSDLTDAASAPGFSFESPASITSRQLNEFLKTREFLTAVAEEAGIQGASNVDGLLAVVAPSLFAYADGNNLVRVGATTADPDASQRLAAAVIKTYKDQVTAAEVSGTETAESILQTQITAAEEEVRLAQEALDTYVRENNPGPAADRTLLQEVAIGTLTDDLARARASLADLNDQLAAAQLRTGEARTVVEQRLRELDPPTLPLSPEPRLQGAILTVALFGVLGLIVSIGLLVLTAALDHTIRVPGDITAKLGVDVLAVVPNLKR